MLEDGWVALYALVPFRPGPQDATDLREKWSQSAARRPYPHRPSPFGLGPPSLAVRERSFELSVVAPLPHRDAGEGGERSEAGEGLAAAREARWLALLHGCGKRHLGIVDGGMCGRNPRFPARISNPRSRNLVRCQRAADATQQSRPMGQRGVGCREGRARSRSHEPGGFCVP